MTQSHEEKSKAEALRRLNVIIKLRWKNPAAAKRLIKFWQRRGRYDTLP